MASFSVIKEEMGAWFLGESGASFLEARDAAANLGGGNFYVVLREEGLELTGEAPGSERQSVEMLPKVHFDFDGSANLSEGDWTSWELRHSAVALFNDVYLPAFGPAMAGLAWDLAEENSSSRHR